MKTVWGEGFAFEISGVCHLLSRLINTITKVGHLLSLSYSIVLPSIIHHLLPNWGFLGMGGLPPWRFFESSLSMWTLKLKKTLNSVLVLLGTLP